MATNDITLYIPPTEEEVMLIQPNNVTFGQYSVTEWQENLLKSSDQRECKLRRTDHYCQKRYSDRVHPFGRSGLPDILQWRSGQQIRISRTRND